MNLTPWRKTEERDSQALSFQDYLSWFQYQGTFYPFNDLQQTLKNEREEISSGFVGVTTRAYQGNAAVFACMETRRSHFSQARFVYRQRVKGLPGDLFGSPELGILETPWPGGTTANLLSRMIQDVDLAGNSYIVRQGKTLYRLRPDWTVLVLGPSTNRPGWEPGDFDTVIVGYIYFPLGEANRDAKPNVFRPDQVAHFAPIPDPCASYRGMSWISALIREIQADTMMTTHKTNSLENGMTPNMVIKFPDGMTREDFNEAVTTIKSGHEGATNARKTLFLSGGADAVPVGANFQQADFKAVQGAGETRIAAAARVPTVIAGFSEGLQGSSLNTGNYQSARRMFADGVMRPMWMDACGALASIITVPGGSELYFNERDVPFLKEDLKDIAEVQQLQAAAAASYVNAGWEPDSIIAALAADDISRLSGKHTNLTSVQLQPPADVAQNGSGGTVMPPQKGAKNGSV